MAETGTIGSVTAVFTGQATELAGAAKQVRAELEQTGQATERLSAQMGKYGTAAERAAAAQTRAASMTERATQRAAQATAGMNAQMEATVPRAMAASAAIRVLEGNVTNNIRAAERFIGMLPGVGAALQAAFPLIGAVAFLGVVSTLGDRFAQFVQKNLMAASQITEAMEKIQQSTRASAHEIELENAKLDEQIAKLRGTPSNGLAVALAQARVEADRLTRSLDAAYEAQQKALKENEIGVGGGIFTQQLPTGEASDMVEANRNAVRKINAKFDEMLDLASPGADVAAIDRQRQDALRKEFQRERDLAAQRYNELSKPGPSAGSQMTAMAAGGFGAMPMAVPDNTALKGAIGQIGHEAQEQIRLLDDAIANTAKKGALGAAEGAKAANVELERYLSVLHRLMDEQDRLENEQTNLLRESDKIQREIFQDMATPLDLKDNKAGTELILSRLDAQKATIQANKDAAESQELWNISMEETTGQITKQQAAILRQSLAVDKLREQLQAQTDNYNASLANPKLWTATSNPDVFAAQMAQTQGQLNLAQSQLDFAQEQNTLRASVDDMFNEWIQKATDLRRQMSQLWESTTDSINDAILKLLTEPRQNRQHLWRDTGKSIFTNVARTGLDEAEGWGLKALGLGGMMHTGKLGTQGNPMWVKSADQAQQGLASGLGSTVSGAASGSGFSLGGLFSTALTAGLPFLADGGSFSGGSMAVVGERGPEIAHFGSSGYMHSNSSLRAALGSHAGGGGRGGDVHHHWNIDARGANDPAAVHNAVNRAIAAAAPQIAAGTLGADRDMKARRPSQPPPY